jgi:hypothetical protein
VSNDSISPPTSKAPTESQTRIVFVADHRGWDVSVYRERDRFTADGLKDGLFLVAPEETFETPQQALDNLRVEIDLAELHRRYLLGLSDAEIARRAMKADLDEQHQRTQRRMAGEFPAVDVNDPDLPTLPARKGVR